MDNTHTYNPQIHHRKSIRLKNYDYSKQGFYFITIVCQDRDCMFGEIEEQTMNLNDAGQMIIKWYEKLESKFVDIKIHEMILMPNHFHCIIENIGLIDNIRNSSHTLGEHLGLPLHSVVQWFKTMTTNEYIRGVKEKNWKRFNGKLWQRNYYEHIIRSEESYYKISNYIQENPIYWETDVLNPINLSNNL